MASYRVALTESAEKELKRLPNSMTARIAGRIEKLTTNPRPSGCRKLKGGVNERRIRIGDYRVVYTGPGSLPSRACAFSHWQPFL